MGRSSTSFKPGEGGRLVRGRRRAAPRAGQSGGAGAAEREEHPTQKPLDLLKRVILSSTKEEDFVLDPFCGSSTTGIAAYMLNRRFVGIDIEKKYIELSVERFKEVEKYSKI